MSLHDQLQASYFALGQRAYDDLALAARTRLRSQAAPERVWPRLIGALDVAVGAGD